MHVHNASQLERLNLTTEGYSILSGHAGSVGVRQVVSADCEASKGPMCSLIPSLRTFSLTQHPTAPAPTHGRGP